MVPVIHTLSLTLFFALLLSPIPTFSADPPESSPSPSPQLPPPASAPSPAFRDSPPAPHPPRPAPGSPSPAPSPDADDGESSEHKKSPTPAPDVPADAGQRDQSHLGDLETEDGSGGMSGGKKAGIAIGVIAAGCVVALGALVYKRRQQNIRRAQYGYVARREFL